MRHSRIRRKVRSALAISLFFSAALFAESRIETFAPAVREGAEIRLEEAFGNRFQISIGSIEGGLIRPITLKDCSARQRRGRSFIEKFNITDIRSDIMLWDLVRKSGHSRPKIDVDFLSKDRTIAGFARIEGGLSRPVFKGSLEICGRANIDFTGRFDKDHFEFEVNPEEGTVRAGGVIADDGSMTADVRLDHIDLFGHDVACDIALKNRILEGNGAVEGQFETKDLIVDMRPFHEITGSYRAEDGVLSILRIGIGNDFKIEGRIFLRSPAAVDMVVTADNANFNRMLDLAGAKDSSSVISGALNGRFSLKGTLDRPKLDARIEIRSGTLMGVDFEHLSATLKGDGPIISIEDSRITRQSGVLGIAGELDLRKAGKASIFDDIRLVTDDAALNWDGVDTAEGIGFRGILMKKRMTEDISFGVKKYINSGNIIDESMRESDEFELEYKLHPNDSLKVMVGHDKDFFGLEHKDKF